jgi:acetyl-CoA acetyltransferase
MYDEVVISGVGLTRVGRHYSKSLKDLAAEAGFKALDEARLDSVDYIVVSSALSYTEVSQLSLASYIASYMGLTGVKALSVEDGEASGLAAVEVATSLIRSGLAENVLVIGVDKLTDYVSGKVYEDLQKVNESELFTLYSVGHAGIAGLLMKEYMERYRVSRDEMSYWPALMHSYAKENPYAMLRFAIDPSAVGKSLPIADPVTLLDSFPLGDGAAALVLSSREACKEEPIAIVRACSSSTGVPNPYMQDDPLKIESLISAYTKLIEMTNIKASDVDVMEIHDSFTITAFLILESLGLSKPGEAAKDVASGKYTKDSKPAVNLSGGLKARGHPIGATGVYMVGELAKQLAGTFEGVKVDNARRALAVQLNAFGSSSRIILLERR